MRAPLSRTLWNENIPTLQKSGDGSMFFPLRGSVPIHDGDLLDAITFTSPSCNGRSRML